jgi:hypothetical protein
VDGQPFTHGITIESLGATESSPTGATFAISSGFGRFRALVGVDTNAAQGNTGSIGVVVLADQRTVVNTTVSTGSAACTIDVEIPESARSLGIGAYFKTGEPLNAALGDPRVVSGHDFSGMPSGSPCP